VAARRRALDRLGELKQGVGEATEQVHSDSFALVNRPVVATGNDVQPGSGQVRPDKVTRGGVVDLVEVLAACQKCRQPSKVWCLAELHNRAVGAECCNPISFDDAHQSGAEHIKAIFLRALGHCSTNGEGRQVDVGPIDFDRADVLNRDPINRIDFRGQQRDETLVRQCDSEFVDDATCALLENFYRQNITPHGTDSARNLPQGARTIWHPDPDDDDGIHDWKT
jgi:hypothetical protein